MDNAYRAEELKKAEAEYAKAREAWNSAKTKKARREANENMVFWSNKADFLRFAK